MSVEPRCQILVEYAKWTALSAVRTGAPIRDKKTVYCLLDGVAFGEVLSGAEGFDAWHQRETEALCCRANKHLRDVARENGQEPTEFPVGWSAKLVNVFLKTAVYAGGLGREGLRDVLHPPLDNGLRRGLRKHFHGRSDMLEKVDFGAIKNITDYADSMGSSRVSPPTYQTVIEGCRVAAENLKCSLIEVEQLAGLGLGPDEEPPGKLVSAIYRCVR